MAGGLFLNRCVSSNQGRTWSAGTRINDVPGAAREGMHGLASGGRGLLAVAWLDLRQQGTRIWRRENAIFSDTPGQPEERLGAGTNPVQAIAGHDIYRAWMEADGVVVKDGRQRVIATVAGARFPVLLTLANDSVLLAYEHNGESSLLHIR